MRIRSLEIENFRGVQRFAVLDLPDAVILAGPNGCGKSSVMDAIRLLKSAYGQYQDNEWQMWFSEFNIDFNQLTREASRVLRDTSRPLVIEAKLVLDDTEVAYLRDNGESLIQRLVWDLANRGGKGKVVIPSRFKRHQGSQIREVSDEMLNELKKELDRKDLLARLEVKASGEFEFTPSATLELMFSTYAPGHLGVIDYHGATRNYGREKVSSVNLDVSQVDDRVRQSTLYNIQQKYTNVKSEMASAYVRELLAKEAGVPTPTDSRLIATLQELFELFFPAKKFLGPRPTPDGKLLFQIELPGGVRHDIDELSSGEKEVLLGYLRLRNSAPRNSVILLDEPELHLNPRLIRGLPRFYQKHIGQALNNQLWMNTHSDTLLREAVDEPAFAVFHMQAPAVPAPDNQANRLSVTEDVERAVIDLIGDLATYTPHARIVLLEGGGDSEVDFNLIRQLFPEFADRVNLVSGGSKGRTRELHSLLEAAAKSGHFRAKFFSIVDRDFDGPSETEAETRFTWDAYHVENYLLEPNFIRAALEDLSLGTPPSPEKIRNDLVASARDTIGALVRMRMEKDVNSALVQCIKTKTNPNAAAHAPELRQVAERSAERIRDVLATVLTPEKLKDKEADLRASLEQSLTDGTWAQKLRGRDILHRYIDRMGLGIKYEQFRNLIISRMRLRAYRPAGIKAVVEAILAS